METEISKTSELSESKKKSSELVVDIQNLKKSFGANVSFKF